MGPNRNYNRFEALDYDIECYRCHNFGHVDGGKNPSQQRETLPVPQVPIRLMNVWYGRINRIMDPLLSKFGALVFLKAKEH